MGYHSSVHPIMYILCEDKWKGTIIVYCIVFLTRTQLLHTFCHRFGLGATSHFVFTKFGMLHNVFEIVNLQIEYGAHTEKLSHTIYRSVGYCRYSWMCSK